MGRIHNAVLAVAAVAALPARAALACGCLAMPNAATPVVQAGERILFAHDGTDVVATIQIRYSGSADQFGWLLPLPSVPTLQIGTDELFTQLGAQTQPTYRLTTITMACDGTTTSRTTSSGGFGCGSDFSVAASATPRSGMQMTTSDQSGGEVVVRDSIGPYDYAVLKADDQTEMLTWLQDNRFFVPAATSSVVTPYIHPGAYFLALKLRAGQSVGDIVPVIVRYASDLPMVPLVLTQVGAVPDMNVTIWLLGDGRAIPRNYRHTVLNDMGLYLNLESYESLVTRATREAPARHTFVTEYAGPSSVMAGKLVWPTRFTDLPALRQIATASEYLTRLRSDGWTFDSALEAVLARYIPEPPSLMGFVTLDQFYQQYDYWMAQATSVPDGGAAPPAPFDPAALTDEIGQRIVQPTRDAQAQFDAHPYLTRLTARLSPAEMTADPVFSENPSLPGVAAVHQATLTYPCKAKPWLRADDGLEVEYPSAYSPPQPGTMPGSLRVETLREAGAPQVDSDNQAAIQAQLGPVTHTAERTRRPLGTLALVVAALAWIRRRR
jgi:hypothetical protein